MADEKETRKVEYIFEGDTESLDKSVNKAIGLFNRLESKMNNFTKSNKAAGNIKSMVNSMTTALQKASKTTFKVDTNPVAQQLSSVASNARSVAASVRGSLDPVMQKLQSLKDKMLTTSNQISKMSSTISYAFRRVSTSSDSGSDADDRHTKSTNQLNHSMNNLRRTLSRTKSGFDDASKSAHNLWEHMRYMTFEGTNLGQVFRIFTGYKWGQLLAEGVQEAVHFTEVMNMFTVAMGENMQVGTEFVETMQELYGLDPTNIMNYTARFHQLATAIDAPTEAARNMSLGLTQMVVDVASLFDMDIEQVANNFTSGMQGMAMAVRKYGFDIRVATLEQTALSLGLELNIKETSEANRQGLRYITMMRQAANATGDFAKTIESPANQMRILKEQMQQLARSIGNLFIPVLQAVLPLLNGFIMALRTIINFLTSMLGITLPSFGGATDAAAQMEEAANGAASGVGGIGDAAKKAAKDMKNLVAPFDELNILNEKTDSAASGVGGLGISEAMDPAIAAAIEEMRRKFEDIEMKANRVRDAILDFLGFDYVDFFNPDTGEWEKKLQWFADKFRENLIEAFPQWKKTINALFDNWDDLVASFKKLGQAIYNVLVQAITPIISFIKNLLGMVDWDSMFAGIIESIPVAIDAFAEWIIKSTDGLAGLLTAIIAVSGAWAVWKGLLAPIVANVVEFANGIRAVLATVNPMTAAMYGVVSVFALSYLQFESVREAVASLGDNFTRLATTVGAMFVTLWNSVLKPVFGNLFENLSELYKVHLTKAIEQFGLFVVAVVDFSTTMLTAVMSVATFMEGTFGPVFTTVLNAAGDLMNVVVGVIIDLLTAFMKTLTGVLNFLTGIFTADWKKAWNGVKDIFAGIISAIVAIFKGAINSLISFINSLVQGAYNVINGLASAIEDVLNAGSDITGIEINLHVPRPPQIPQLATGGVVSRPTVAMIGEGSYDEAVIPLGESPQLAELVDKIAQAVHDEGSGGTSGGGATFDITLELDGDVIYRNQQKVAASKGRQFNLGGFAR